MIRLAVALAPLLLAAGVAHAQDPHAGHAAPAPDPDAGHDMSGAGPTQDPHAGHATPAAADPHAAHRAPAAQDPHAGHDMGAASGPPDMPTSADTPGRPPEDPTPAAALSGPRHAADAVFPVADMVRARDLMRRENGDIRTTAVVVDRLEAGFGDGDETWLWDAAGWTGGDINRFWWKSEGEGDFDGGLEEVEVQALYGRAITPFWDVQAGVRQDYRRHGEETTHLALGVQGLAPHWWEVDAAAFISTDGDLTARIEAEYDQRLTRRLILQSRFEVELAAGDIPELGLGSGLTSVAAGLRLRYEVRPELAPYFGLEWSRALGETADLVEAVGGETDDTRVVFGLRAWF